MAMTTAKLTPLVSTTRNSVRGIGVTNGKVNIGGFCINGDVGMNFSHINSSRGGRQE